MLFIESFDEVPNPDALSEKRGWYRYEVLKVGDKRCDLFMKSKSARRDFDEVAKGNYGSSGQSSKRCVGATPIEKPTSILIQESRESHWKKTLLGVHVGYTELRNSSSGFIHAKYKSVTYRGSFMYLLATSIYVDGRSTLGCNAPQSLTLQQAESFSPISHLPAISF